MTAAAAIDAQVVDIQNDRMHKGFIKVTLHVAAERGAFLTEALGWPTYTRPVPVALARLNLTERRVVPDTKFPSTTTDTSPASDTERPARAHRPVAPEKKLAQRAGILCNDPVFARYLHEHHGAMINLNPDEAASWMREFCHVESRADIVPGSEAATRLDLLQSSFIAWRDVA